MEGIPGALTIADHDSGDGSFELLTKEVVRSAWTRVRVLQSGRGGGFGAGSRQLRRSIGVPTLPNRTTRVDWLAEASVLVRMDVPDRVGLCDEAFFLCLEEAELLHRAAQAGKAANYVRASEVEPIGSAPTGMKA